MPTEDAYSSGHLVLSHFGTCMCSNVETNLSWTCLVSGLLNFEHPSVLLFCALLWKNPLWYGILCWFFVTTAHQYITFKFLITTKQVQNSVKVSAFNSRYLWEKFPKIGLTSYVDNTVASLPRHGHRDVRRPPQTPCHQRVQTQWGYAGNRTRISRSKVQPATSSPTRRAPRFENYN